MLLAICFASNANFGFLLFVFWLSYILFKLAAKPYSFLIEMAVGACLFLTICDKSVEEVIMMSHFIRCFVVLK